MAEASRLHLALFKSMLAKLEAVERADVLNELLGMMNMDRQLRSDAYWAGHSKGAADVATSAAAELESLRRQLDEARETTEEWKRHSEQRMEEVYAAREILGAKPNETLPMAVERFILNPGQS